MEVTVIEATDDPERLVCQAGRGDYYDGYIGDTEYVELMESVDYDKSDIQEAVRVKRDEEPLMSEEEIKLLDGPVEAKTKNFIDRQASRGHWGLWEHPQITFAVEGVSRVTMAQITRHRHLSFDIQSMRYADFSEKEAITPKSLTDPDHFTRETGEVPLTEDEQREWERRYEKHAEICTELYQNMVRSGVPKEDARFILPLGTPVNMTFSGNARSMMHVLNLRQKANAQWEVRELSNKVADELEEWMPYTGRWWRENGPMQISP